MQEKCSYKTPLDWNEFLTETKIQKKKNVPFYCLFLQHREKIPILLKYFCIEPQLIIRVPTLQRKFVELLGSISSVHYTLDATARIFHLHEASVFRFLTNLTYGQHFSQHVLTTQLNQNANQTLPQILRSPEQSQSRDVARVT